jgi:hypothetical protein
MMHPRQKSMGQKFAHEKRIMTYAIAILFSLTNVLAQAAFAAGPIRIMLLDGQSAGTHHDWKHTTPVLKKELDDAGIFKVDVVTAPASGGDFRDFKPQFIDYKAIVMNYDGPGWPPDLQESFDQFVRDGGGLVIVHAADNSFADWPNFNRMIGIGGWRDRNEKWGPLWYFKDGQLISDATPGSAGSHGARNPFQVTARQPDHPILKGLPKIWMHAGDELYANLRGPGEHMTVIATAYSDPANKGTGHDEPMLMVIRYGKGRVFHTAMGHDIPALACNGFIATLQRGTEWTATGKVTLKVPANFPTADAVSTNPEILAMKPPPAPRKQP